MGNRREESVRLEVGGIGGFHCHPRLAPRRGRACSVGKCRGVRPGARLRPTRVLHQALGIQPLVMLRSPHACCGAQRHGAAPQRIGQRAELRPRRLRRRLQEFQHQASILQPALPNGGVPEAADGGGAVQECLTTAQLARHGVVARDIRVRERLADSRGDVPNGERVGRLSLWYISQIGRDRCGARPKGGGRRGNSRRSDFCIGIEAGRESLWVI